MAKTALTLNPTCSAELWNALGDALFEWGAKPGDPLIDVAAVEAFASVIIAASCAASGWRSTPWPGSAC